MRDSFIFYRSYFEAIQDLKEKDKVKLFEAICELSLNGKEKELIGIPNTIFKLIKPLIIANNERYENGKKGGRPKKSDNSKIEKPMVIKNDDILETKTKPNKDANVNDNEIDNDNEDEVELYEFLSSNFGYTIPPIQIQKIQEWLKVFDNNFNIIKFAIEKCCNNNARTFSYLEGILQAWKLKGFKLLEECKSETKKKKDDLPEWANKEIKKETSEESQKEMEEILKDYK